MAAGSFASTTALTSVIPVLRSQCSPLRPKSLVFRISIPEQQFQMKIRENSSNNNYIRTTATATRKEYQVEIHNGSSLNTAFRDRTKFSSVQEKLARKKFARNTYLVAALMFCLGISSIVYFKFSWQMEKEELPVLEMFGTSALSIGAAIGMEYWARWAHRTFWHASLWRIHESHHRPRDGPFEVNDVLAIINAVPAIALLYYGFFNAGVVPGFCFAAGLGITVYGMAYMFVHDGMVHRRFPVGPIAQFPYLRRIAAAHHLHHKGKFDGVPYGLFLGPQEVEIVGGLEELDKEVKRRMKSSRINK